MRRIAIIAIAAALFASTAAALADDTDADPEASETSVFSEAQLWKAKLLAGYDLDDGAELAEIEGLRTGEPAVGWGAIFKLLQLEAAGVITLDNLVTAFADGEGWAFGRRFKELGDSALSSLEGTPKNFGQFKKQLREPKENQGKKPQDD